VAKLTPEMKEIAGKMQVWSVATADKDGMPNVVPIAFAKVLSDDEILLVDNFLDKTKANIKADPKVAISVWDLEQLKGYQFKGTARIETSGTVFDEGVKMVESVMPQLETRSAVIVTVTEIYVTTPGPDAGKRLS